MNVENAHLLTKKHAYDILLHLFEERGCRSDIVECINEVLESGARLNKTCIHFIHTELDRLTFEIPFQRIMGKPEEMEKAMSEKAAFELLLELSNVKGIPY